MDASTAYKNNLDPIKRQFRDVRDELRKSDPTARMGLALFSDRDNNGNVPTFDKLFSAVQPLTPISDFDDDTIKNGFDHITDLNPSGNIGDDLLSGTV